MARFGWILVMALLPVVAAAQAYRWVDEKGQVHYSQVPPPGKNAQPVGPVAPPAAAPNQESLNRTLKEDSEAAPQRRAAAEQASQIQAQAEAQCSQAREQLVYMDAKTSRRFGTTDAQGNVSRTTEEQFQERRAELQRVISERCS